MDKKDGKVNKGIFDIHVIDVYFTGIYSNPSVFDTSSVAKISNSKRELQNEQRLVKGEVTMCIGNGSKIDMIIVGVKTGGSRVEGTMFYPGSGPLDGGKTLRPA